MPPKLMLRDDYDDLLKKLQSIIEAKESQATRNGKLVEILKKIHQTYSDMKEENDSDLQRAK